MNVADSIAFLQRDLAQQIRWQSTRLRRERVKTLLLKTLVVGLAAATTVLLGLEGSVVDGTLAKNLALVFGAVILVVSAWDALFDHQGLWVMHTTTKARLQALQSDLEFYVAGRDPGEFTAADAERFAERRREIEQAGLAQWLRLHADHAGGDESAGSTEAPPF